MKLEWMGQYRPLIEEYIKGANRYAKNYKQPKLVLEGVPFSASSIQVLEYILENEELGLPMSGTAKRLGITRSAFTKIATALCGQELIIKSHPTGNGKEYHLKLTDKGRHAYEEYMQIIYGSLFKKIFEIAQKLPKESIDTLHEVFKIISRSQQESGDE